MRHLNKARVTHTCLHKAHHSPRALRNTTHFSTTHMGTILNSKVPTKATTTTKSAEHEPKQICKDDAEFAV